MAEIVNGLVNTKGVYYPNMVTTIFLKTWSLQCGKCEKDFVRFSIIGRPKCPHCGTRNHLNYTVYL